MVANTGNRNGSKFALCAAKSDWPFVGDCRESANLNTTGSSFVTHCMLVQIWYVRNVFDSTSSSSINTDMPKLSQDEKGFLNMAGEFLVAAELNRRKILSAVTYGNSKSADVWAFDSNSQRAARIEVKTTREGGKGWVIGNKALIADGWSSDLFWVLVLLPPPLSSGLFADDAERGRHVPRFFIFTAKELGKIITARHYLYGKKYFAKYKLEWHGKGLPIMPFMEAAPYENQWKKIEKRVRTSIPA